MPVQTVTTRGRRSRLLLRGESSVAAVGLALAAIMLGAMGASAWWLRKNQIESSEGARAQQVRTVGDLLSQNVETSLTANDLAAVRRAVSEAGATYHLTDCR